MDTAPQLQLAGSQLIDYSGQGQQPGAHPSAGHLPWASIPGPGAASGHSRGSPSCSPGTACGTCTPFLPLVSRARAACWQLPSESSPGTLLLPPSDFGHPDELRQPEALRDLRTLREELVCLCLEEAQSLGKDKFQRCS